MSIPRGVANHNPGNIREPKGDATHWVGERATDDDPAFEEFVSPEFGFRALGRILLTYRRLGILSVGAIIAKWAPPSENDTGAYVRAVADHLEVHPDDDIDVSRPETMALIMRAISRHENGYRTGGGDWWTDEQIAAGTRLAAVPAARFCAFCAGEQERGRA